MFVGVPFSLAPVLLGGFYCSISPVSCSVEHLVFSENMFCLRWATAKTFCRYETEIKLHAFKISKVVLWLHIGSIHCGRFLSSCCWWMLTLLSCLDIICPYPNRIKIIKESTPFVSSFLLLCTLAREMGEGDSHIKAVQEWACALHAEPIRSKNHVLKTPVQITCCALSHCVYTAQLLSIFKGHG